VYVSRERTRSRFLITSHFARVSR